MNKILVAVPYLHSGGVEVTLVRFLKEFSKNKNNEIDLLMLKKEGMYIKDVPKNVNIIEVDYDNDIYSYEHKIKDVIKIKSIKDKLKFINYRLKLRKCVRKNNWGKYYKNILKHVIPIEKKYDLAIDWHGYGHFITTIVADKVTARKKIFWVHDEKNDWVNKILSWIDKFDKIFCVGISCKKHILKNFPNLKNKVDVFYNVIDYNNIRRKANLKEDLPFDNHFNIVTIGRLEWQKGYDIAIEIANELKQRKFDFCWYVIGDGHRKNEIMELAKKYDVLSCFKLLGLKANPYPYIKNSDLFVLSSRHEGYCTVILEAKILNKIVVATDIPSNREQIQSYENGILCKLDASEFANAIIEVANNEKLKAKIENNLLKENFDFTGEFEKLYNLMEE